MLDTWDFRFGKCTNFCTPAIPQCADLVIELCKCHPVLRYNSARWNFNMNKNRRQQVHASGESGGRTEWKQMATHPARQITKRAANTENKRHTAMRRRKEYHIHAGLVQTAIDSVFRRAHAKPRKTLIKQGFTAKLRSKAQKETCPNAQDCHAGNIFSFATGQHSDIKYTGL